MKNIDLTLLRKRREKILALRKGTKQPQHIGVCYAVALDGKIYPVMACFPTDATEENAKDKLKYLINGGKN